MDVTHAIKRLIIQDPFYGLFALNLDRRFDKKCPTLGVTIEGINPVLLVNKEFWESLSDKCQMAVIKHEIN